MMDKEECDRMDKTRLKVLIVDDVAMNRELLSAVLGDESDVREAADGLEALEILKEEPFDLMLLDLNMPRMDGMTLLKETRNMPELANMPVIVISADDSLETLHRAYELGAVDYLPKKMDTEVIRRKVADTVLRSVKQKQLLKVLNDQVYERERNNRLMVMVLSNVVEFRNGESATHVQNINVLTEAILRTYIRKYGAGDLTEEDISLICLASSFHDIGKIAIDGSILNKPGRLTDEEFETIKTHTTIGADMLSRIEGWQEYPVMRYAYEIARWHHERFDGRGYPDHLHGDEIPLSAQVVAVADVYDALISERVYKPAYSHETALEMIFDGKCGMFNPKLLMCLEECKDEIRGSVNQPKFDFGVQRRARNIVDSLLSYEE